MSNHVNRFYAALSVLAGHGDIKQRLIDAYEQHLAAIETDDLPRGVRQKFSDLHDLMSGVEPLNGEGRIRATVRKMSVPQADECALLMLGLYTDLVLLRDHVQEVLPLKQGEQPAVPPFLVKSG